jgi:hypothetical protein
MQLLCIDPTQDEYLPASQATHVLASLAPSTVEYVPARQLVQTAAPAAEYLPFTHVSQRSTLALPGIGNALPAAQSVHASVPTVILYLPAAQNVHAPSCHVCPSMHDCAPARVIHAKTLKTPKSRMPHTPRAFIHSRTKMGFALWSLFKAKFSHKSLS